MEFSPAQRDERAGLIVTGYAHAALCIRRTATAQEIVYLVNNQEMFVRELLSAAIRLRVDVADGGLCTFSYVDGSGEFVGVGESFQASKGQWVGARVGLFSVGPQTGNAAGFADFQGFQFH